MTEHLLSESIPTRAENRPPCWMPRNSGLMVGKGQMMLRRAAQVSLFGESLKFVTVSILGSFIIPSYIDVLT